MVSVSRNRICKEALGWIGTPYLHQASTKMAGCDCLGLVRGVWRAVYGQEPAALPPYSPDWDEQGGAETLKQAADIYLKTKPIAQANCGDVLLFRMCAGAPAKHMAIILSETLIVHAYWGRSVTKSFLAPYWLRRRAYAYEFPNVRD